MRDQKQHKKYCVEYCSGATGYGWSEEYDSLDEFEYLVNEMRHDVTAAVWVYDYKLGEYIFIKRTLTYEPEVDLFRSGSRDFRTKTRKCK